MSVPERLRELLATFGRDLPPYPGGDPGGRGVVMCAGGVTHVANAFVALRFLRKVSDLPVELFHAGPGEMPAATRARLEADFAPLSVRDIAEAERPEEWPELPVASYGGFQIKPFALLHTRFDEVLLLDADNLPLRDPEPLFDSAPYREAGALFWPDLPHARHTRPELLDLFGVTDPDLRAGPEFESGQMVLDRRRCWAGLLHTALAHSDREGLRAWCFARTFGDKDLFRMAFELTRTPYHRVRHAPQVVGTRMVEIPLPIPTTHPVRVQHPEGTFAGTGMIQHDLAGGPLFLHKTIWEWNPYLEGEHLRHRLGSDGRLEEMPLLRDVEAEGYGYLAEFRRRYRRDFGLHPLKTAERWANGALRLVAEAGLRLGLLGPDEEGAAGGTPRRVRADLRDVTFTIPVRIEHPDRAENLRLVVHYLLTHFDTNLIVCEQDTEEVPDILDGYPHTYLRTTRPDGLIHHTRQLNVMALEADTPFIVNHDADVLLPPERYVKAARLLREEKASWVLPYSGDTWDVDRAVHPEILRTASLECVGRVSRTGTLIHDRSTGGVVFFRREDFIRGGMDNERFVAWGDEDTERYVRFRTLGYRLGRLRGPLYHLAHHRTPQSDDSHAFYARNKAEYRRIEAMSRRELEREIETWSWCP